MRRKARKVQVGNTFIGGDSPVSVQGMTKSETSDIPALTREVRRMVKSGAEIVRIAILNEPDIESIPLLKNRFHIPIVADIHYSRKLALLAIARGADKIRINPGNLGKTDTVEIIKAARAESIPIRIGLNSGSVKLSPESTLVSAMVKSAMDYIHLFEDMDFHSTIISLKTPSVESTISCYRELAELCDYPFHLGITEAGRGPLAESKSILGVGILLFEGIGDTIRVSLTEPSDKEIIIGKAILQALGLRKFHPEVISCPTCGRCRVNLQSLLSKVEKEINRLQGDYPGIADLKIAVMGCGVNGPGEAKQADIGIAGVSGDKFALFKKGETAGTYPAEVITQRLIEEIKDMLKN